MIDILASKFKITPSLILVLVASVASFVIYIWFLKTPYFVPILEWCHSNYWLLMAMIVLLKVIGIIWPPLPGGLAAIAVIPIVGFFPAYLADLVGSMIGCSIVYFLGKWYGHEFLAKVLGIELANQAEKLKIREGREYEAFFAFRALAGGVFVELVSYSAGLTHMKFNRFFFATLISHAVVSLPIFFLYGLLYSTQSAYIMTLSMIITLPILWKIRGRYFEIAVA
jgi:uncharacterized membrane protein YdjX (TVP38/TMEM64 family)